MASSYDTTWKSHLFSVAAQEGNLKALENLAGDPETDINWIDGAGWTALHYACRYNKIETLEFLLQMDGIQPNKGASLGGITPFLLACWNSRIRIVSLMVADQRIDVNRPNNDNQTPLWNAACSGHYEVVRWLLSSGRVFDTKTTSTLDGTTAARVAREKKWHSIADLIESYEKNPVKVTNELRKKLVLQE